MRLFASNRLKMKNEIIFVKDCKMSVSNLLKYEHFCETPQTKLAEFPYLERKGLNYYFLIPYVNRDRELWLQPWEHPFIMPAPAQPVCRVRKSPGKASKRWSNNKRRRNKMTGLFVAKIN